MPLDHLTDRLADPTAPPARVHRLTQGGYEVLISDTGAGLSSLNGLALNRWRPDPVEDDLGTFIYLRDLDGGRFWSLGYQPTRSRAERYEVGLEGEAFVIEREDAGIEARLSVTLPLVADGSAGLEVRGLSLTNLSTAERRIEVTSYLEAVLFHAGADAAHPAFAKLFVQTERAADHEALLARRRPRAEYEAWPWLVHALVGAQASEWETDRMRFLGRGRTPARPAALICADPLSGSVGNTLDPCLALRTVLHLGPGGTEELSFLTGAAMTRAGALALVDEARALNPVAPRRPAPGGVIGVPRAPSGDAPPGDCRAGLQLCNGYGGFTLDGREYVVRLPWQGQALRRPPLPWTNVIANERCGVLASETGAGNTWARNSQANRLTPWQNDPVSDPHGEAFYIRDEATQAAWSPLPGPMPAHAAYECRHGLGYSVYTCEHADLATAATLFVPREDPLRILSLRLTHRGAQPRTLSLFSYQRLVLGSQTVSPSPVVTAHDPNLDLLTATNSQAGDFAGGVAFACIVIDGAEAEVCGFTCDRAAFLGRHGDPSNPLGVQPQVHLNGASGAGLEPCFAQSVQVTLAPGQTLTCAFLLGEGMDAAEIQALVGRYRAPGAVAAALDGAKAFWSGLVSGIQVQTPSPAIDLMVNAWLPYQNLGCRIWARSAFYQSGGAFGFRDQLQDAAALVYLRPDLTRAQLLLHAAHQFVEGDVLHWWHPAPMEKGLRTRFADDLLWLPFVAAHYIRVTGDQAVLAEQAPFLKAPPLTRGEDENYLTPEPSGESADLYEHCCRALDHSLTRGEHGLPLMGTGDWNDGMNRVGRRGRGESVWMGFFLYRILGDFLPLMQGRDDKDRAGRYATYRQGLAVALEEAGWDGAWYRRAYYDDGTPLGCAGDAECRIDALAQSWSVLSGAVPRARAEQAMDALEAQLLDEPAGILRLLTPPFVDTPQDPGYIKGYVAGVRENGGQYTHAACWAVQALAGLGRQGRAARLLEMLSPVSHATHPDRLQTYKLEPYAVAADIYGEAPHVGRGGWSWYTGSAGWMYRAAIESILGLGVVDGRTLEIRPCIPAEWPGYTLDYRLPDGVTRVHIRVDSPQTGSHVVAASLDGRPVEVEDGMARVTLPEGGGDYQIEVVLG